jgi:hypothetical protein
VAGFVSSRVANVLDFDSTEVVFDFVENAVRPVAGFPRPAGAIPFVRRAQVGRSPKQLSVGEQAVSEPVGSVQVVLGNMKPDSLGVR